MMVLGKIRNMDVTNEKFGKCLPLFVTWMGTAYELHVNRIRHFDGVGYKLLPERTGVLVCEGMKDCSFPLNQSAKSAGTCSSCSKVTQSRYAMLTRSVLHE